MATQAAKQSNAGPSRPAQQIESTPREHLRRDFASRGLVVLAPEALGVPAAVHDAIYRKERQAYVDNRKTISATGIPEILQIVNAPGVVAACNELLGEHWAVVPFTHNAPFASGAYDQHWHKDDNGPFNGRRQRRHHAIQVEMLYYPQAVSEDMGPTATVPYSHYWAFNHEENHDNFAGADHLDFGYYLSGMEHVPVSGPKSAYEEADIRARRTRHDVRMREAIANTGWPLVRPFEAAPLAAGSVVLYSHNLLHRGNHRCDDWRTWQQKPRFMWRFWLYRTRQPVAGRTAHQDMDWNGLGEDALTGHDLAEAPQDATAVWSHHYRWLCAGGPAKPPGTPSDAVQRRAQALFDQLHAKGEAAEPQRIGAAYRLVELGDDDLAAQLLGKALHNERETVRRAASYGLVALGAAATDVLLAASRSPVKWVRKAGVFGLGDAGRPEPSVFGAIAERLAEDPSVYVRSVAADALGGLGRRAVAAGTGEGIVPLCAQALTASLVVEENRLAMNIAQDRSIKLVRPTDECDVCEGIGINYGEERFLPVRSLVRENALCSLVVLSSHGVAILGDALEPLVASLATVAREDKNVFSVGLALDALCRLANLHAEDASALAARHLDALLAEMPMHSWESLVRSGCRAQVPRPTPS